MPPTVTIFVPTYNRPDLIAAALESALAQTFDDFVITVGDNGGSPLTEGVVARFDDPRVRYVRHPENLGAQGNWLELIRAAESPIVASLHDDDVWEPTFLERVVPPLLDDPTVSMVFTDYWLIDEHGTRLPAETAELGMRSHRDRLPAGRFDGPLADGLRMVAVWNSPQPAYAAAIRRDAVLATEFPPDCDPIYDIWLSYRILARGEGLYYVPEKLTNYRTWPGSMTAAGFARPEDAIFRRILDENPDAGPVLDEIRHYWAELRYGRAGRLMADRARRAESQDELRAAAPHLSGPRKAIATAGARSTLAWEGLRGVRSASRRGPASLRQAVRSVSKMSGARSGGEARP